MSRAYLKLQLAVLCCSAITTSGFISTPASFVLPARPPSENSSPAVAFGQHHAGNSKQCVMGSSCRLPSTSLHAKKTVSKKIQVKMLKHVEGTGSAGDVVMVSPAFFANKLRPLQAAVKISDEEVQAERSEAQANKEALTEAAEALKAQLEASPLIVGAKAGPTGQLFGGLGAKALTDHLANRFESELWTKKGTKIKQVTDADGKKMRGDIKHVGNFGITVAFPCDVSAKVAIEVVGEKEE